MMSFGWLVRRFCHDRSGQVAVLFGLLIVPLIGFVGAATDYSAATSSKAAIQSALDASVLAAALAPPASRASVAADVFASIYGSGNPVATTSFSATPDGKGFSASASAKVPSNLMKMFGFNGVTVNVASTAAFAVQASNVCILLLETSQQGMTVNGSTNLSGPNCEVDVRSTTSPAAAFNGSSTFNVKQVCVAGSNVTQNGVMTGSLQTSCATASDPFAGTLPSPSTSGVCTTNTYSGSNTITLSPGVYCAMTFNGSTSVQFTPGLYVIRSAAWTANGSGNWSCPTCTSGAGVTFYLTDASAKMAFNGSIQFNLTAPTTGPYANILFFEPSGLAKSSMTMNGSQSSSLSGLLYLPSRNMTFNGSSTQYTANVTMVFNTLAFNGSSRWALDTSAKTIAPASGNTGAQAGAIQVHLEQ